MVEKKSPSRYVFLVFDYVIISIIAFICLAPLWHVFIASISDPAKVEASRGLILVPLGKVSAKAYELVFENPNIIRGYLNTFFYVSVGTCLSASLSILAGYVMSRKKFKFRNAFTFFITFTMMFHGGMIPSFIVVKNYGLLNTVWAVLLPSAMSVYNTIIMRTAFAAVPDSLEESAKIDGAGDWKILFSIMLPLIKSTLAVIVLFYAVTKWNAWFDAMIYLTQRRDLYPLQLFLREILTQAKAASSADSNAVLYESLQKYATIIVATVPILCIYPFVQKYFVTGVMVGSVKG
jgi:putative aldouronate transport system permease protein